MSSLKSFGYNLVETLGFIWLPMKLGNDNDGYLEAEETFYVIDAPICYNDVMSIDCEHKMGAISPSLYQVMKFPLQTAKP